MSEHTFANGLIFKLPTDNAPDWVKGKLSIKVEELIPFLEAHAKGDGWINIDLKVGKSGKGYAELNTWTREQKPSEPEGADPNAIPF